MSFETYQTEFTKRAKDLGYSSDYVVTCLRYAQLLFENNVPVIYNTSHLSSLVGYKKSYIKRAVSHTLFFYREFSIPKKNGKKRIISEPLPSLKEIQIWILNNILYRVQVSKYAKAYVSKGGVKQNAVFHKGQKIVLTLDIDNFFTSITIYRVEQLFLGLGYSKILANLLSKLCCLNDCLPQGAPTSPCISNIFLKDFDHRVADFCRSRNIRFTRYADDLTFSGDFEVNDVIAFCEQELKVYDLSLNAAKTKIMKKSDRQVVTGIVVNEKLQVPFLKRNQIRKELYYIKKYGLDNHMSFKKINKANYLKHLLGKVSFILNVNPNDGEFKEYEIVLKSYLK